MKAAVIKQGSCKFNKWVDCEERSNCKRCGWNPLVTEKRLSASEEEIQKAGHIIVDSTEEVCI